MKTTLERLHAKVQNLFAVGRTTTDATNGPVQMAQVQLSGLEVKDAVPITQDFGFASLVPAGTDVVVTFVQGDRSNAAAVATNHQKFRPQGMKPGESQMHDNAGQSVYLQGGTVIVMKAGERLLVQSPGVSTTGNLSAGNGATGTFTTPLGLTVTVVDGIIINIT